MYKRAACFIDGFNLYHSLDNSSSLRKYKWLDLWEISQIFLTSDEKLTDVFYFSAYTYWNADREARHRAYVAINENKGCRVTLGKFQEKERISAVKCSNPCALNATRGYCSKKFVVHEEKMTDVNIALAILEAGVTGSCDAVYLLSGDNDLVPALETTKRLCPNMRIRVILPPNAKAKKLMSLCNQNGFKYLRIKERHLMQSQLQNPTIINEKTYHKPSHW